MPDDGRRSIHLARLQARKDRTARRLAAYAARNNVGAEELASVQLPWFAVQNTSTSDGGADDQPSSADVFIYDEIGGSFGVDASVLCEEINGLDVDILNVRINSPGGSVFDALAIHSTLLHHRAHVRTYVDGLAASAASVIAMAGDDVVMMPGSEMMIHDASNMLDGNAQANEQNALYLHRQSDNIAGIYAARAGGTPEEWRALMQAETWLFAREAVAAGLATSLYPYEQHPVGTPDSELESRMRYMHDLTEWRYRHTGRRSAPPPNVRQNPALVQPGYPLRIEIRERTAPPDRAKRSSELRAAANLRAARFGEMQQDRGRQLRLQEHVPSGIARPAVDFTSRLVATTARRDGKEFVHLDGYATIYDKSYEMWDAFGPYDEIVVSGAADATLAANPDTAFLVNHRGLTMARTTNGSLILNTDSSGMPIEAWLNPVRSDVQLLRTAIDDGDITEMSFAFVITRGEWSDDFLTFYIRQFDIDRGDVSAVNYGANPYTSIGARAREIMNEMEHLPEPAARAMMRRLSERLNIRDQPAPSEPPAVIVDAIRQTGGPATTIDDVKTLLTLLEAE